MGPRSFGPRGPGPMGYGPMMQGPMGMGMGMGPRPGRGGRGMGFDFPGPPNGMMMVSSAAQPVGAGPPAAALLAPVGAGPPAAALLALLWQQARAAAGDWAAAPSAAVRYMLCGPPCCGGCGGGRGLPPNNILCVLSRLCAMQRRDMSSVQCLSRAVLSIRLSPAMQGLA